METGWNKKVLLQRLAGVEDAFFLRSNNRYGNSIFRQTQNVLGISIFHGFLEGSGTGFQQIHFQEKAIALLFLGVPVSAAHSFSSLFGVTVPSLSVLPYPCSGLSSLCHR